MEILKMKDGYIIQGKFLVDMIGFIYEQCEIDKNKEIIIKTLTKEHISIKIKECE